MGLAWSAYFSPGWRALEDEKRHKRERSGIVRAYGKRRSKLKCHSGGEWHLAKKLYDGPKLAQGLQFTSISSYVLPNVASSSQKCVYGRLRSYDDEDEI